MPSSAPNSFRPRLVIFDLDGVVYRGDRPVAGAAELIRRLHDAGTLVRYATNNSTVTRRDYVARLERMGIRAAADEVATSSWATVEHLRAHEPGVRRVLAVGERGLVEEFRAAGYEVVAAADAVGDGISGAPLAATYDACVVGLDREFDYRRLTAAVTAVRAGAALVATNADTVYPTADGSLPGAGAMVAAIAAATGARPLVIGKPEPALFQLILEAAAVSPDEALVVGDNPDSDIIAARRTGIRSVLVLTGVADRATADALDGERRPHHVADGPEDVDALLTRWAGG